LLHDILGEEDLPAAFALLLEEEPHFVRDEVFLLFF